ncbi:MAG: family 20 glycosylhydrolase, partial [Clostridia bacterium]|nr:family 20 glycosylhydrolase [Clostridia bacterium]
MFAYRGFMLDSVRHMQSIEEIKKLIDALSLLGFNKFHWHLTDDQGWRFESERFPVLNSVAAVRPYSDFGKTRDNNPYGRVYTKAEMREIVAYCTERGIDVIPEIDMPGHTRALLSAFPSLSCTGEAVKIKTHQGIFKDVLCLAKEETFEVITAIIDEFLGI